jgi:hypothetical protein
MNKYYICPYGPIQFHGRTVNAARVLLYATTESTVAYRAQPMRDYCLAVITDPLPSTQAAIDADGIINTLPFTSDDLDREWQTINQSVQDTVLAWLTAKNIPTTWIVGTSTILDILTFVVRLHNLCQMTGTNFLQGDLSLPYNSFNTTRRNAFRAAVEAWLATQGRAVNWASLGLTNSTPLGTILTTVVDILDIPVRL